MFFHMHRIGNHKLSHHEKGPPRTQFSRCWPILTPFDPFSRGGGRQRRPWADRKTRGDQRNVGDTGTVRPNGHICASAYGQRRANITVELDHL